MNLRSRFCFLFSLLSAFLLPLTGCKKKQFVDGSTYNAADWEQRMKSPRLNETEFTQLYAQAAAAQLKGCTVRIAGPKEVVIKFDDGGELKAFLDNAWAEATKAGAVNRADVCRRYLASLTTSRIAYGREADLPDTNNIVAVIRDDLFLKQYEKLGATTTNRLVHEPLAADLHVVLAIDSPGAIAYLTEGNRKALSLDLPALRKLSLLNLRRILPEVSRRGSGPLYMLTAGGDYESSLLLSDKLWNDQSASVEGNLVAAVPSRDVLLFTGSASTEGIKQMRQTVDKIFEGGSHVISKTLLVRRNGRWEKFSN